MDGGVGVGHGLLGLGLPRPRMISGHPSSHGLGPGPGVLEKWPQKCGVFLRTCSLAEFVVVFVAVPYMDCFYWN